MDYTRNCQTLEWNKTFPKCKEQAASILFFLLKLHFMTVRLANSLLWTHLSKTFHQSSKVTYWKSSIKDTVLSYRAGAKRKYREWCIVSNLTADSQEEVQLLFLQFVQFFSLVFEGNYTRGKKDTKKPHQNQPKNPSKNSKTEQETKPQPLLFLKDPPVKLLFHVFKYISHVSLHPFLTAEIGCKYCTLFLGSTIENYLN